MRCCCDELASFRLALVCAQLGDQDTDSERLTAASFLPQVVLRLLRYLVSLVARTRSNILFERLDIRLWVALIATPIALCVSDRTAEVI